MEEITCERVKGLNKRTGHRGGGGVAQRDGEGGSGGSGDHSRKIGFRQARKSSERRRRKRAKPRGEAYKSIRDSPTIRTGK